MAMRKWSGGATYVVQVQDPRADLAAFDLVIPPEHDAVRGDNVFSILGAPVHFPAEALAAARARFVYLAAEPRPRAAVVIGGPSKSHKLSPAREIEIETRLAMLTKRHARLWITASRRTPASMVARLRAFAQEQGQRFWAPDDPGPNPYLGFLQLADVVLVTEDSTNMIRGRRQARFRPGPSLCFGSEKDPESPCPNPVMPLSSSSAPAPRAIPPPSTPPERCASRY
jgi:mitochondrial fission protein ELM1